jgi:hypothetical protein
MIKWLYHKYVVWKVKRQIHRGLVRYFNEPIPEIRWEKLVEDNKKALDTLLNSGLLPTYNVEVEPVTEQEKAQGIVKFKITHPNWRTYEVK